MNTNSQRSFIIGDSWLYYKLYTGTKTSEQIITDVFLPLTNTLKQNGTIQEWFFIRYADPHQHLRLRLRYTRTEAVGDIINTLQPALSELLSQDLIWKVQIDTYQRELERYGANTIEAAEDFFHHESVMIAKFIALIDDSPEGEELRWLFSLRGMDAMLQSFGFSMDQKLRLMRALKDSFAREFHMDKYLKKQVNDQYRDFRQKIRAFMTLSIDEASEYTPILQLIEERRLNSQAAVQSYLDHQTAGTLQLSMDELLASLIHMFMNRLFKSKQRLHEMVGYDFLYRYYMATSSRQKAGLPS